VTVSRVWPARAAGLVLVTLGFIPFASFLNVGLEMPGLAAQLRDWGTGTALTLGIGLLAWMSSRRGHWPARLRPLAAPRSLAAMLALVTICSLIFYALVASVVFSRRPLLIDELAQLWQAQRYAEGHLWIPAPAHREFFSFLHLVDIGDKVYAQFPPGGPFMLWLGTLVGAPWLVGPVCGALSVRLFARLARAAEPDASNRWVLGATVLFALTPFGVFMYGSYMNHVTALLWILVALAALIELVELPAPAGLVRGKSVALGLAVGFGFGMAATIRPLDAFAFALPAAAWLVARARFDLRHWIANAFACVGVAVPFAVMMYVNLHTTGHPLRFGYEVLWGATHGLGFHAAPWGEPHTPLRGLALASLYQWRLQTYLFETPFPSLLLPSTALLFSRTKLGALDKYLLGSGGLVIVLYLLYWHDGFYLGPRFVVPLLPVLVLWTARVPRVAAARLASVHVRNGVSAALAFGVVGALVFNLPVRVATYRASLTSMRVDYARSAERAGVRDALVFVRESWGAQLVARLWGLGVARAKTEAIYRGVDACDLDLELSALEREGARDAAAEARLRVLLARDSALVEKSTLTPDPTERVRVGAQYPPSCLRRIDDDRAGFLHYAPLRLVTTGGNLYARDLQGHDSLLVAQFPDRPVYLLKRAGIRVDAPLQFLPLRRDSLIAAWRLDR
jgi:hypothetical protein